MSEHPSQNCVVSDLRRIDDANDVNDLSSQTSEVGASTSTLQDEDSDQTQLFTDLGSTLALGCDLDNASTSHDANSSVFDKSSLADPRESPKDLSMFSRTLNKPKKMTLRDMQQWRDAHMWKASNAVVMKTLLSRRGTPDELIKWEAIATARGLCTLTDCCNCRDCRRNRCGASGLTDGDGGLGTAPLFGAISFGCSVL